MGKPYTQLYYHFVWATWDREPLIAPAWEEQLHAGIIAKCDELRVQVMAINGVEDHVHLLVGSIPALSLSELIGGVKGAASHLVNHRLTRDANFRWQGYYGAFTVSRSHLPKVKWYVLSQKEHHANGQLWPVAETMFLPD